MGLEAISAEFAYARGYTGKGVTIGIIDNAILSHSEFAGKLTRLDNGSYNFSYDKQDNMSFGDHGTHVAGIAAARRRRHARRGFRRGYYRHQIE